MSDSEDGKRTLNGSVSRRGLMAAAGASAMLTACGTSPFSYGSTRASSSDKRPNIIFILADDLGYADLSCFGRRDYETPHLDRLASQGVRFTHAYSNSPVCSATRTAIMAGQYQYRMPIGLEEPLASRNVGYEKGRMSMPLAFQSAGYQTALVGKWHLGALPDYSPLENGYDHFWGIKPGGVDYFTHRFIAGPELWDGETQVEETGYLTNLMGMKAIEMLDQFSQSEDPFFLSLHFTAPHWPFIGPNDQAESARLAQIGHPMALLHYDGGNLATYAEMVTRLDFQVGQLLDKLDTLGLAENTIVVFSSDNGGERFSDTWPFSGRKAELLEGGIRVPTIMRWPDGPLAAGDSDVPIMSMDWFPTFLAMAGVSAPADYEFDGLDMSDSINSGTPPERDLYFRFNNHDQAAVRRGKWKLSVVRTFGTEGCVN
ncbi:sulfatase-like hydrolase/transferase [Sphingorhabdus sp. SMR4y]|uniref:sulfatase-like hydrolase/transferase n=1 Tax=Sphingorhabdus sp. SMR4y TaxID=2584094 RepID=UPI000B5FF50A|nr:sulfatase-like hydrolase/transferase [Sphingorhabdus sp. SMR4y]ASK89698.1 arylsulfatase [Sphingorhabdus sp. SMR4y]